MFCLQHFNWGIYESDFLDELRKNLKFDSNIDFSLSDFENFQITAFALHSSMQTDCSFRMTMVASASMNQLVNKISPPSPLFLSMEKKDMVVEFIYFF